MWKLSFRSFVRNRVFASWWRLAFGTELRDAWPINNIEYCEGISNYISSWGEKSGIRTGTCPATVAVPQFPNKEHEESLSCHVPLSQRTWFYMAKQSYSKSSVSRALCTRLSKLEKKGTFSLGLLCRITAAIFSLQDLMNNAVECPKCFVWRML